MIELVVYRVEQRSEDGMTALGALIDARLQTEGWSLRDLAAEAGVSHSTISRLMNDPAQEPNLSTLDALSRTLKIPMRTLVEACGYTVEASTDTAAQVRIRALVGALPGLELFLEHLTELSVDDRDAILTMAEALVAKRRRSAQ